MSYKLSLSAFLTLVLSSTSALALTCANDYGGSGGCASNVTAAGDCETLGYATGDVEGCEHYLFCPFNQDYKRCVAKSTKSCAEQGFTTNDKSSWCGKIISCESDSNYTLCAQKLATCPVGELDPYCDEGYAKRQVDITEDFEACYECAPATCEVVSDFEYVGFWEYDYNDGSGRLRLPEMQSFNIYDPSTETMKSRTCYKGCSPEVILKPVSTSNCAIGDWLVRHYNKYYCTSSSTPRSLGESCSGFEVAGIIGYHYDGKVYAVYPLGKIRFSGTAGNAPTWNQYCPDYYNQASSLWDFYSNYLLLTGRKSSQFGNNSCYQSTSFSSSDLVGMMDSINEGFGGLRYGVPNDTIIHQIFYDQSTASVSKINKAAKNWSNGNVFSQITTIDTWADQGRILFDSSGGREVRVYTSPYNNLYSSNELKQGILVMNASEL